MTTRESVNSQEGLHCSGGRAEVPYGQGEQAYPTNTTRDG